jgi:hypothetical protein
MPSISKTNGLCPKFTLICSPCFFIPTEGKSFPLISRNAVPDYRELSLKRNMKSRCQLHLDGQHT